MTLADEYATASAAPVTSRLVPASIGRPGRVQTVYIPCPAWCHVDHVEVREVALEDVTHYGPGGGLQVPSMLNDDHAVHEWYVNIISDPAASDPRMRAAHLVVANGGPDDAHLTDEQAEQLAAELERMAADVRAALAVCRTTNADQSALQASITTPQN
ncbi:DUF6907 domain-containing protein [Streptomyces sp. NPDC057115]|jgi:hypothetical protein|uniref:DUF6907 domain-containing protein n=1 Tax=Streptomyces sp. NPDC057115 TaxID=3346022 RepID=UPI003643B623